MSKAGLGGMLKQMQAMQGKIAEMQAEMEAMEVEGTSGGGMVKIVATGKHEIKSVSIDPEVVNSADVEMLQDLIVAAINQVNQRVNELQAEKMSGLTGGLNIPGLSLPF